MVALLDESDLHLHLDSVEENLLHVVEIPFMSTSIELVHQSWHLQNNFF